MAADLAERASYAHASLHAWSQREPRVRARVLRRVADELLRAGESIVEARERDASEVGAQVFAHEILAYELAPLAGLARRAARSLEREGGPYEAERAGLAASRVLEVEPAQGALVASVHGGRDGLVGAFGPACGALAAGHAVLLLGPHAARGGQGAAMGLVRACFVRAGVPSGVVGFVDAPWASYEREGLAHAGEAGAAVEHGVRAAIEAGVSRFSVQGPPALAQRVARVAGGALTPCVAWVAHANYAVVSARRSDYDTVARALAWGAFARGGVGSLSLRFAFVERGAYEVLLEALGRAIGAPAIAASRVLDARDATALERALRVSGDEGHTRSLGTHPEAQGDGVRVRPLVLAARHTPARETLEALAQVCAPLLVLVPIDDVREAFGVARRNALAAGVCALFAANEVHEHELARGLHAATVLASDAPYTRLGDAPIVLTRPSLGDCGASDPLYGAFAIPSVRARATRFDPRVPLPGPSTWRAALHALRAAEGAWGVLGALREPL